MPDERQLVDETVEADFESRKLSDDGRFMLPTTLLDEYDLRRAVIDVQVVQGESSAAVMDAEVGPSGKVTIPAKKRDLYGFECGEYVSGVVDKVVMR